MTNITRRAALGGIATLPTMAGPSLAASETVADRCLRLAGELSEVLTELDSGNWEIAVRPAMDGVPVVALKPLRTVKSPDVPREELIYAYLAWLDMEKRLLYRDIAPSADEAIDLWGFVPTGTRASDYHRPLYKAFNRDNATWNALPTPARRARLVLTTVGCDLRSMGERP